MKFEQNSIRQQASKKIKTNKTAEKNRKRMSFMERFLTLMLCNKMKKPIWISNLRVYVLCCVCLCLFVFFWSFFGFLLFCCWFYEITTLAYPIVDDFFANQSQQQRRVKKVWANNEQFWTIKRLQSRAFSSSTPPHLRANFEACFFVLLSSSPSIGK